MSTPSLDSGYKKIIASFDEKEPDSPVDYEMVRIFFYFIVWNYLKKILCPGSI